jgi:hypothetical protein
MYFTYLSLIVEIKTNLQFFSTEPDTSFSNDIDFNLNDNGTSPETCPLKLFRSENRYRDAAFNPDGSTIDVITDIRGPYNLSRKVRSLLPQSWEVLVRL